MQNILYTPYDSMRQGYAQVPKNVNIKLIFRHSFRPTLRYERNPDNISLTAMGYSEAYKMGKSIPMEIGFCSSSPILRCLETIHILTGIPIVRIQASEILGYSFVEDDGLAKTKFIQTGLKETVFQMSVSKISGFVEITKGIGRILDFIFASGGDEGKLDLYCTHDMHLALLDLLVYNSYKDSQELKENWPRMLEGAWLWGVRNDFFICWRNQIRRCINYLPSD